MIPLPPHVVRGQVLTADFLNRLLDALRAVRPIQGQGILLRETPQGTVIEATAKTSQRVAAAAAPEARTPQPFELRVREAEGEAYLDIYSPQGTCSRFLNEERAEESLESTWESPLQGTTDAGWFTFGAVGGLTFDSQGVCRVALNLVDEAAFRVEAIGQTPSTAGYTHAVVVGSLKRTGQGTEASPYSYGVSQFATGTFRRLYVWLGGEGLFVQNGSTLTDDLDGVTWTKETQAWLCRLYGLVADFPDGGRFTLENPCAEPPVGTKDGKPVFASKLEARAHAADHFDDFIPYDA